jgi:hypothetical protein
MPAKPGKGNCPQTTHATQERPQAKRGAAMSLKPNK